MTAIGNLLLLGVFAIGNAAIWIALVNRLHGLRLRTTTLKRIRHLHDILILGFPFLVIGCLGLSGPKLLLGGEWSDVSPQWKVILFCSCCGVAGFLFKIFQNLTKRVPVQLVSSESTLIDIQKELGFRPIQPGPYYGLARLPMNDQFRLELNEKHIQCDQLHPSWDGLSILHLSDLHVLGTLTLDYYKRVFDHLKSSSFDVICFTGDLIDNEDLLDWISETLGQLEARIGKYFILGNHDWYQHPDLIRQKLQALGWQDVTRRNVVIEREGQTIEIAGDETPWMPPHPMFDHPNAFRLLLSHTPDNLSWAQKANVDLMLSGHNHGGQIKLPLLGPVYSPSTHGCRYSDGSFYQAPTFLHVSRGIAGQHPYRWRCPPEATRLILRSGENSLLIKTPEI
ncbi:metallophosphoesterase [Planctomicrobium sp. SH668]|uniref:metallophosphoesterase n=1 Tax=Planctomicrobium sp. SH668 TaxID=3448126 RepID=UPI003F5C036C